MKESSRQPSEKGLSWQRELFSHFEDVISRRLAERRAAEEMASARSAPPESSSSYSSPPDVGSAAAGDPAADGGLVAVPVSSGVGELDARLGGGFFPGLWMIVGPPGSDATAFLGSVAVEAVADHRAIVYYALAEGTDVVRGRLLDTLTVIMADGVDDAPGGVAERCSTPEELPALNPAVWLAVLSRMWLVESVPEGADPVGAFLRRLERTLEDVASELDQAPVVLIDDLETLLRGLRVEGAMGAARVVTGLNGAFLRCGSPGLMASPPQLATLLPSAEEVDLEGLLQLGHGLVELLPRSPVRMDVTVHQNPHAAWRGTLPLVLYPAFGMFAVASDARG